MEVASGGDKATTTAAAEYDEQGLQCTPSELESAVVATRHRKKQKYKQSCREREREAGKEGPRRRRQQQQQPKHKGVEAAAAAAAAAVVVAARALSPHKVTSVEFQGIEI